jgi:hypothetical protein
MGSDPRIGVSVTILAEVAVPRKLIGSHDAEEARTGLFLVPRRPDLPHPSQPTGGTVREPFA